MMIYIIILLLVIIILSYFVFLYDLNNFIQNKDNFSVKDDTCYNKNMANIDVEMRPCKIYYTKNTSLCDSFPELYILSKNNLRNYINNPRIDPNNIIINNKKYTLQNLKDVLTDKSRNNISSTCSYEPNGLYEIDNNIGDANKYQKKVIINNNMPNNNYLYSCFLPLDDTSLTSNGYIKQSIIDSYNTDNMRTPCVNDNEPITNITCRGNSCPTSNKFLSIDLNIAQKINNNKIDIDDTLIFIRFKKLYDDNIVFDSFVQYNKINKVFENIANDNPYIKSLINEKLCNIMYKNGNIYLSPKILDVSVFTFTFNDNGNILFYNIINDPFTDFSLKYLSINDTNLNNYSTSMTSFYDPVVRLADYISKKTKEPVLNIDRINNYITEYNNIKYNERIQKIKDLEDKNKNIENVLRPKNQLEKNNKLEDCPVNKDRGGCNNVYQRCRRSGNNYLYCFNNKYMTCLYCNRSKIEAEHKAIDEKYLNNYNDNVNQINSINNTPLDISNNINRLETYQGIYDIINPRQLMFNNAYKSKMISELLSYDDNCIYVNIPV